MMSCSQPSTDILPPGSFTHLRHSVQKQNDGSSPGESDFSTVFARRYQYHSLNIIMKAAFYITLTNTHLNWTPNPWTHRGLDLALIHQGMDTGPLRVSHGAWRLRGMNMDAHEFGSDLEARSTPWVSIHVPRPFPVSVVCRGALSCWGAGHCIWGMPLPMKGCSLSARVFGWLVLVKWHHHERKESSFQQNSAL